MKMTRLFAGSAALGLAGLLCAGPVEAQADFSKFVQIGDSLTAGFLDNCLVKYGQLDSYGIIFARQAKVSGFEQPLVDEPGLGGCRKLTSLAPGFSVKPSTGKPLNLTLARPYDNLAVPGFKVSDVVDAKTSADNGNALTDLVLRGLGTQLQQAASLKPTFLTIWIGNNDILGAATSGTVVDGVTLTPKATFDAKFKTITDTMKAAQGGTGKGVAMAIPDVTSIPFFTTVSPIITTVNGTPITFLSARNNTGAPTSIPTGSIVTLLAASFIGSGYGIPCQILEDSGAPANHPQRANCNKPLPDQANPITGVPGVVLYPEEIATLKTRTAELNASIKTNAESAGYKFFDTNALFADVVANGRVYGGMKLTTAFLSGGIFSYDGVHPTSTGYAVVTDELIQFINASFGTKLEQPNLYPYLFEGNTSGGYSPTIGFPMSPEDAIKWSAEIFPPESWQDSVRQVFPVSFKAPIASESSSEAPVQGDSDFGSRTRVHVE
jgi:lysophospholipase L1-like esterase